MKSENTKEQLIQATVKLLSVCEDASQITARQIAEEAEANLAMINYYFKSKEELMNIAVGRIISDYADNLKQKFDDSLSPREQLRKILYDLCDVTISYSHLIKISIPFILLHDDITHPWYVLPIIREHFGSERSEAECRIIAYQMISFMQLVLLRSDDFFKYSGMNIFDVEQRNKLIDMQLDIFLNKK